MLLCLTLVMMYSPSSKALDLDMSSGGTNGTLLDDADSYITSAEPRPSTLVAQKKSCLNE
jgi:hypothetical protein